MYLGDPNGPSFLFDLAEVATRGQEASAAAERLSSYRERCATESRVPSTRHRTDAILAPIWISKEFNRLCAAARVTTGLMHSVELVAGAHGSVIPVPPTRPVNGQPASDPGGPGGPGHPAPSAAEPAGGATAAVTSYLSAQTVSMRLLKRAPVNLDRSILADLAAGYVAQLDTAVLTGRSPGARGLLATKGTNAVTYADPGPTPAGLYAMLADGVRRVGHRRPPDCIVMHPRRWAWIVGEWETAGGVPQSGGTRTVSSAAQPEPPSNAPGAVGLLVGLPVYLDESIPTNRGAGENEDQIVVGRFADGLLLEGPLWAESEPDVSAGYAQADIRVGRLVAFSWARNPAAFSIVTGSGLVAPRPPTPRRPPPTPPPVASVESQVERQPVPLQPVEVSPPAPPAPAAQPRGSAPRAAPVTPAPVTPASVDPASAEPARDEVQSAGPGRFPASADVAAHRDVAAWDAPGLVRRLFRHRDELVGIGEVAEVVLAEAQERAGAEAGCVLLPDGRVWRVSASAGARSLENRLLLEAKHWLVEELVGQRHGVVMTDSDIARSRLVGAPLAHWRHLLGVPIGEVDGMILLARETTAFAERDLTAVAGVAEEAGPLLSSALDLRRLARALADYADEED